jgi:hypothetical protein
MSSRSKGIRTVVRPILSVAGFAPLSKISFPVPVKPVVPDDAASAIARNETLPTVYTSFTVTRPPAVVNRGSKLTVLPAASAGTRPSTQAAVLLHVKAPLPVVTKSAAVMGA